MCKLDSEHRHPDALKHFACRAGKNAEKVYSRGELVDCAYGLGHAITDRTVDSHIRRIRRKLSEAGADPIETVYGVGYRVRT